MIGRKLACVFIVLLLAGTAILGYGQVDGDYQTRPFSVLLVDETKTFSSTMKVGALAGLLENNPMLAVTVRLVDTETSYSNPLLGIDPPQTPFDAIIIIPLGIDDGSVSQIWIITGEPDESQMTSTSPLNAVSRLIGSVFGEFATTVGVADDLYLGLFSALCVAEGWL